MLMPVIAEVFGNIGITKDDVGFICSGSTDYLDRRPVQLRHCARRGRRVAARGPSPTSRWTGPGPSTRPGCCSRRARSTPPSSTRFGRSSPGDLERDPDPAARPLLPGAALARPGEPRRAAGPGPDRRGQGHRGRLRRRRRAQPAGRAGQPQGPGGHGRRRSRSCWPRTTWSPRCAATPCRRSPTAPPPSCWPPATGPASWSERPAWITGIDHRIETHSLGRPGPHHLAVDGAGPGPRAGVAGQDGRRGRAARPLRPPGADPRPSACGLDDCGVVVNPSGGRWRPTR